VPRKSVPQAAGWISGGTKNRISLTKQGGFDLPSEERREFSKGLRGKEKICGVYE